MSGGLITNYYCTSCCRHCLYNCSPDWPKEYISPDTARKNLQTIRSMGCHSIHIGGGEPMLLPEGLMEVLAVAAEIGMQIDYVETNSSWFRDPVSATKTLARLKELGLRTLLISISPFHNEHIPFFKIKGVMAAALELGIGLFPWVEGFMPDLAALDPQQTHNLREFEDHFGQDYLQRVLQRYWIHPGGRAIDLLRHVRPQKTLEQTIMEWRDSCAVELSDTSHFHIDLFGNFIPGLCSGLAISTQDLGKPLEDETYPLLTKLFTQGIRALYQWARERYDFKASRESYVNKCDLCTDIRTYLVQHLDTRFNELNPLEFYNERLSRK